MKIKVVKSTENTQQEKLFLSISQTNKTIIYLENDPVFEEEVNAIRNKYQIKQDWLARHLCDPSYELLYKTWPKDKLLVFNNSCRAITVSRLFLPCYWWQSIAHFVAFDVFPTPEKPHLEVFSNNPLQVDAANAICSSEKTATNYYNDGYLMFALGENVSKRQLHKLIDEQWYLISQYIENTPKVPIFKLQRVNLAQEIVELKDNKNMTFPQISDFLSEKFADDDEITNLVCSQDYVKILYHRWKKSISEYGMCPF